VGENTPESHDFTSKLPGVAIGKLLAKRKGKEIQCGKTAFVVWENDGMFISSLGNFRSPLWASY